MADKLKFTSKLQGSRVFIIGGLSGIGYAVAEAVLEFGGVAIISSSNPNRVTEAVQSLSASYPSFASHILGFPCDVGEETTIEANVIQLLENAGPLDHIVYTAGDPNVPMPIADATLQAIKSAGTVRYVGPIFVAKHAPKYLKSSADSSITLTTGIVTARPIPNWSVIAGMRSATIGLGQNLALDLKPIRVNVVSVGAVETNSWSHISKEAKDKMFEMLVSKSTTGRIAQATDVAEAYLYCMRDRNVTGSVITTSSGSLLV